MFTPLTLGALRLEHRVVMAPLTRTRGTDRFVPCETAKHYYGERATKGGLLISEAIPISPEGGYEFAPGLYTAEQERAWSEICAAVHARGGYISAQLWHTGRAIQPSWANHEYLKSLGRALPSVSVSAVAAKTTGVQWPSLKAEPLEAPRELTADELRGRLVDDYRRAARAAMRCGFDAVEVHAAHGYLINQALVDSVNKRTDEFGGSFENRARLLHLVMDAVVGVCGADRVGVRVSPTYPDSISYYQATDSRAPDLYRFVVKSLDKYKLAYLLLSEPRWTGGRGNADPRTDTGFRQPLRNTWAREVYSGPIIGAGGFTPASAAAAVESRAYDAVAFGRFFISNPDLVKRLRTGADLNIYDRNSFYIRDPVRGYVDYPALDPADKLGDYPVRKCETIRQADIVGATLEDNVAAGGKGARAPAAAAKL